MTPGWADMWVGLTAVALGGLLVLGPVIGVLKRMVREDAIPAHEYAPLRSVPGVWFSVARLRRVGAQALTQRGPSCRFPRPWWRVVPL